MCCWLLAGRGFFTVLFIYVLSSDYFSPFSTPSPPHTPHPLPTLPTPSPSPSPHPPPQGINDHLAAVFGVSRSSLTSRTRKLIRKREVRGEETNGLTEGLATLFCCCSVGGQNVYSNGQVEARCVCVFTTSIGPCKWCPNSTVPCRAVLLLATSLS